MDEGRQWDFVWFHGAAGVGKSAVAQTIAEYAAEHGRLGAAYFFSRGGRSDYSRVWITIAYQLAVRIPAYQASVARQLAADPDILNKAPHVQFKRLIVDPLSSLPPSPKFLITLDGLDECKTEDAQLNIIELINSVVQSTTSLPIVWMVYSRPEYHIRQRFSDNDFAINCWKMELSIDSKESKDDVALFVRSSFKSIRRKYTDIVGESWPCERRLREIIDGSSGLFAVASTVVRYIDDPEHNNPEDRLRSAIRHLCTQGPADKVNPMAKLDHLYTNILSETPSDILPTTLRIIHSVDMFSDAMVLANFFGISRGDFYCALRKLHSLLGIPTPSDVQEKGIEVLHKSFSDYLSDPNRSGRFHLTKQDLTHDIFNNFSRLASSTDLLSQGDAKTEPYVPLTWEPSDLNDETNLKRQLCWHSAKWVILHIVASSGTDEDTLTAVRNLDYKFLVESQRFGESLYVRVLNLRFCRWMTREVCFLS